MDKFNNFAFGVIVSSVLWTAAIRYLDRVFEMKIKRGKSIQYGDKKYILKIVSECKWVDVCDKQSS